MPKAHFHVVKGAFVLFQTSTWVSAKEDLLELLSPTRCAGCERPGDLICERCLGALDLIDPVHSCLACGAPHGDLLCTECSRDFLHRDPTAAQEPPSLDRCLAMAGFSDPLPRIIRAYKDAGERRMAPVLAELLADTALHAEVESPDRYGGIAARADAIAFVPATAAAYRRRGFDHMEAIARPLSGFLDIPLLDALVKHGTSDQRELDREARRERSRGAYEVVEDVCGLRVLLVDDVITTGATVRAAASALKAAGACTVDALALARVW